MFYKFSNLYKKTGTLTITLASGTENYLSDGTSYVYEDETSDEPDATIFSKSNLIITGSGALNVSTITLVLGAKIAL